MVPASLSPPPEPPQPIQHTQPTENHIKPSQSSDPGLLPLTQPFILYVQEVQFSEYIQLTMNLDKTSGTVIIHPEEIFRKTNVFFSIKKSDSS